jgi:gliding motility-associated-like protein
MKSYFWDFGDGITDTTLTPNTSHIYNSYGNFTPMLIMQDPTGCIIPLTGFRTIKASGADANLGAADSIFCDRAFVQFTDSSTFNDPIVSYNWTFGDGGTATTQNPAHNYTSPGQYTVQLIVRTALGCLDTFAKQNYIKIVQRPLVNIAGDTIGCARSAVDHSGIFIQPDTSVVRWSWNFPNGNSSSVQDPPAQVYNSAGDYQIRVIATNSTGCRDTVLRNLHIKPLPNAILPGSMTVQNGFPTVIPATYSPGVISWNWTPTNGLSCTNCPTPAASPSYKTTYRVSYSDIYGCSNFSEVVVFAICKNANLFIPNSFTPNNDGTNDVFYPRGKGLDKVKSLRIFNRWGQIVFEKKDFPVNDASQGWNGSFKGTRPVAGVYIYQAEVYCENGEIIRLDGNVALIL